MEEGQVPRKKKKNRPRPEGKQPTNVGRTESVDDFLDMPTLPSADEVVHARKVQIKDGFDYDVAFNFGFIGIGQGGSRVAQTFYDLGYRRVVVIDGAHQDLQDVRPEIAKLDLETSGSAKDIAVGADSVRTRDEEIRHLIANGIGDDVDIILVCACLGGGTGSGAAEKVIQVARQHLKDKGKPVRVGAVVSLPSKGEGQRVAHNAVTTFARLRTVNPAPMIIIDNQRIGELFPVGVSKLYAKCNEQTAKLFHLFNKLAAQRSRLVTFDRAELADLLDRGIVVFGASPIQSEGAATHVSESIRKQLAATSLARVDLTTATGAGAIFVGPEKILDAVSMDLLDDGFNMLLRLLGEGSTLHRGVYIQPTPDLRCLTLLSGLGPPADRLRELGTLGGVPRSSLAEHFGIDDS